MKFIFGAITIVCLFGCLSLVFPNVLWRDITYFFRENKEEYLQFSNRFRGKYYFILGCVSLALFILSFFVNLNLNTVLVLSIFFISLITGRIFLEIGWSNQIKKNTL